MVVIIIVESWPFADRVWSVNLEKMSVNRGRMVRVSGFPRMYVLERRQKESEHQRGAGLNGTDRTNPGWKFLKHGHKCPTQSAGNSSKLSQALGAWRKGEAMASSIPGLGPSPFKSLRHCGLPEDLRRGYAASNARY